MASISHASEWELSTIEDGQGPLGTYTSLALDMNDHSHISYYDQTNEYLMYAHWNGTSWDIQVVDSEIGGVGRGAKARIGVGSDGYPQIAYCAIPVNVEQRYAYWDGEKWNIEIVDSSYGVGSHTSMALDNDGTPWIAYPVRDQGIMFKHRVEAGVWDTMIFDPDEPPNITDAEDIFCIDIDDNGSPHISYFLRFHGEKTSLKHAYWDGHQWCKELVDDDVGTIFVGYIALSLSIESNGERHIAYHNNCDLHYAHWNGIQWNSDIVVDNQDYSGRDVSIAVDRSGNPHIGYYFWNLSGAELRYAYFNGMQWSTEIVDDSFYSPGRYPSIALDSDDLPHISYYDSIGEVRYACWNGTDWDIEVVDGQLATGLFPSLALDNNGYPHVSYSEFNRDLFKHAHWDGVQWNLQVVPDKIATFSSLAVDVNGHAHISYYNFYHEDLRYAYWDGVKWDIQVIDKNSTPFPATMFSSLALDTDGLPHISYIAMQDDTYIKYAYYDGRDWNTEIVTDDCSRNWEPYTSLALDSKGYPHISYYGPGLKYAYWDGAKWNVETIEGGVNSLGLHSSLALDSKGHPHISYCGETRAVKHAWWDGEQWNIEIVDNEPAFPSLSLDSNGYPHISYIEYYTSKWLKYAGWDGEKWNIEKVVDIGGTSGRSESSIRIDANDNVHIVYFDEKFQDLKYAYKFGEPAVISQHLVTTPDTDYNWIAYSLDAGFTTAEELGQDIPNCLTVSTFDASTQGYITHPVATGINNFAIQVGHAYQVTVSAPGTWFLTGTTPTSLTFDLITTPDTDYNWISLPFGYSHITTAEELGQDIPNCLTVSTFDASTQGYITHPVATGINNFIVQVGYLYQVTVSAETKWP